MIDRKVFSIETPIQSSGKKRLKFIQNDRKSHIVHFTHVFRPIYYFTRLCGHMPFSIVRNSNDKFRQPRVNKCDAVWFAISICIYTGLAICICWYLHRALTLYSTVKPILYLLASSINILRLINYLCGILMLIMDMCNRYKLVNIFNKFTMFDRKVSFKVKLNIDFI